MPENIENTTSEHLATREIKDDAAPRILSSEADHDEQIPIVDGEILGDEKEVTPEEMATQKAAEIAEAAREYEQKVEKPLNRVEKRGKTNLENIFSTMADQNKTGVAVDRKDKKKFITELINTSKSDTHIGKLIVEVAIPLETAPATKLINSLADALVEKPEYEAWLDHLLSSGADPESAVDELKTDLLSSLPEAGKRLWLNKKDRDRGSGLQLKTSPARSPTRPSGTATRKEGLWDKIKGFFQK